MSFFDTRFCKNGKHCKTCRQPWDTDWRRQIIERFGLPEECEAPDFACPQGKPWRRRVLEPYVEELRQPKQKFDDIAADIRKRDAEDGLWFDLQEQLRVTLDHIELHRHRKCEWKSRQRMRIIQQYHTVLQKKGQGGGVVASRLSAEAVQEQSQAAAKPVRGYNKDLGYIDDHAFFSQK